MKAYKIIVENKEEAYEVFKVNTWAQPIRVWAVYPPHCEVVLSYRQAERFFSEVKAHAG